MSPPGGPPGEHRPRHHGAGRSATARRPQPACVEQARYGARGSLSIDLDKGTFYDHEAGEGGGVLDLIRRQLGLASGAAGAAVEWLRKEGFDVGGDARRPSFAERIVCSYCYEAADGTHAFDVVRLRDPKTFRQRAPDGTWSVKGIRHVLYRLPQLLAEPRRPLVFITEGEKDADALAGLGLVATTNPGGAGKWRADFARDLAGRRVAIIEDNDDPGRAHAEVVRASLAGAGIACAILDLDGLPPKGDVSDWIDGGGTVEQLVALAEAALDSSVEVDPAPLGDEETIAKLAALDPLAYDRARKSAAKSLGVGVRALDEAVAKARPEIIPDDTDDNVVETITLWPDPVDGLALAEEVRATLKAYVVFGRATDADALTVWIIGTYLMEVWRLFPKGMITSPTKRCGKTTLLETIEALVHRGLMCANITAPALFRSIDKWRPTLLLDEADQFLRDKPELNGVINVGHSRQTASVLRCVEVNGEQDVKRFSVWGAQAFASIGKQRDTLIDRSIVIGLRRKLRTDKVKHLPADLHERMLGVRRQIARWTADNVISLGAMDDEPPVCGNDRLQDNYTPIWRLAKALGGVWPERIKAAYAAHAGSPDDADEPDAILLMQDMLAIIGTQPAMHTETLLKELHTMEDRPWPEHDRGRPLTATALAELLKPFEIKPKLVRVRGIPLRGHIKVEIAAAAVRYVDESPSPVVDESPSPVPPSSAPYARYRVENEGEIDFLPAEEESVTGKKQEL